MIRIVSNYLRLFASVAMGLIIARLLLRGLGSEAYALIALIGSASGIIGLIQGVVSGSLNRELAAAHHSETEGEFERVYAAALRISLGAALLLAAGFLVLLFFLTSIDIPPAFLDAARLLVLAKGVEAACLVLLVAPFNMYLVAERMVAFNAWTLSFRVAYFVAAIAAVTLVPADQPELSVIWFGFLSSGLATLFLVVAVIALGRADPRIRWPAYRPAFAEIRDLLSQVRHNVAALIATNIQMKFSGLIMNIGVGFAYNDELGIAVLLTGYIRRLAIGMTDGLDVVSARVQSLSGREAVRDLLAHSSRLHGVVVFPAAMFVLVVTPQLLTAWLGLGSGDEAFLGDASLLIRILAVGMALRAVGDGWQRVLYGAGFARNYAIYSVLGALTNPAIAVLLIVVLPEELAFSAIGWGYAWAMLVFHAFPLALVGGRGLDSSIGHLLKPLFVPLALTLVCLPIPYGATLLVERWSMLHLLAVASLTGLTYAGLSYRIFLSAAERAALWRFLRRRGAGA
ncbi:MAG: hypothetical protein P1V51_12875 [Deltaproteobacteria bacterium]|nr:hypothetical protein [Deltaproteobacteria bacterium]